MNLDSFINQFVINTSGKINTNACKPKYWSDRSENGDDLLKELLTYGATVPEAVYKYHNNTPPVCKVCGSSEVKFISYIKGYMSVCSKKCSALNPDVINKRKNTCIDRYGVDNIFKSQEFKSNLVQYNWSKYGTLHHTQSSEVQDTRRNTTNIKYGVDHVSQLPEVKLKKAKTNMSKLGVECPFQSDSVKRKTHNSILERYGVDHISQADDIKKLKIQRSLLKFGTMYPTQSDEIKGKTQHTNVERYGVTYPIQSSEIYSKLVSTNNERYGVGNVSQIPYIKIQKRNTLLEKCGVDYGFNISHHREVYKINVSVAKTLKFNTNNPTMTVIKHAFIRGISVIKCLVCGSVFDKYISNSLNSQSILCPTCHPDISVESSIRGLITNLGIQSHKTRSIIPPKELDIFIPDYNVAIEYNGLMFHSEGYTSSNIFNDTSKDYHLNKTEEVEAKGIQLFHIFENEWLNLTTQNIWKSVIKHKLTKSDDIIYARKTIIKEVSSKEAVEFLNNNHLQGSCQSSIRLGLYYNDELVSLMTFGKSRFNKNYEYELLRFCNILNTSVVGGASKLLKYFERNYNPKSLISYANRRWSTGDLYNSLGFEHIGVSKPNYFYFRYNDVKTLYSRNKFQKHKLSNLLDVFDENLSEYENMKNNKFRRIFDSGNHVFSKLYKV